MNLCWGDNLNVRITPRVLHCVDRDKRDGNPVSICGRMLLYGDPAKPARFGESREGKCPRCFKISRQRLQKKKAKG